MTMTKAMACFLLCCLNGVPCSPLLGLATLSFQTRILTGNEILNVTAGRKDTRQAFHQTGAGMAGLAQLINLALHQKYATRVC